MAKSKIAIFLLFGSLGFAVAPKKAGDRPEKITFVEGDRLDEKVDAKTLKDLIEAGQAGPKEGAIVVAAGDDSETVKTLQAQVDALTVDKTKLEGEKTTLEDEVKTLKTDLAEAQELGGKAAEQIAGFDAKVETFNAEKSAVQTENEELKKQVKQLTADLDKATTPKA